MKITAIKFPEKRPENLLTVSVGVSDRELIALPHEEIERRVNHDLATELAKAILKNKSVTIEEAPHWDSYSKRYTARVVVMDERKYHRLKAIEKAANSLNEAQIILSKNIKY
ncbi:hypothetical protein NST55_28945 [Bacillus sp. FSL R10-2789]|uniref:hypothetical protein n=1 Tax=Bacillus sp. FSL R10-2789 TaxID=2954662 RepID=UPI0030F6F669